MNVYNNLISNPLENKDAANKKKKKAKKHQTLKF